MTVLLTIIASIRLPRTPLPPFGLLVTELR